MSRRKHLHKISAVRIADCCCALHLQLLQPKLPDRVPSSDGEGTVVCFDTDKMRHKYEMQVQVLSCVCGKLPLLPLNCYLYR